LVDEFQDTNRAQDLLLQELLGEHRNLMVVGDDDQSIYRWRGARIQNILDFAKNYAETKVFVLGTNYRSSKRILRAADAVISRNEGRKAKNLDTPNPDGAPITRFLADDEYDEARYVARLATELQTRDGLRPGDIAVFYRTNAQSRMVEEKLLEWGIPYVVIGGTRFYDRKEIKDALAYLRLLINPADAVAFARVVNFPPRGIGPRTLEKIVSVANRKNIDLVEASRRIGTGEGSLATGLIKRVKHFAEIMDNLLAYMDAHRPAELADRMLRETGYLDLLQASAKVEDKTRLENLQELLKSIEDFEKEAGDEATLDLFLERVSLLSDPDLYDERANAVSLMTLHAAKGLEFPAVIMVGLEDKLLPHSRSMESEAEYEEERRLCYVGMTRAKQHLFFTAAATRRTYGGVPMPTRLSPFWQDLPHDLVEDVGHTRPRFGGPVSADEDDDDLQEPTYDYSESQDPADFQRPLELNCRVKHLQFGYGTIYKLSGTGPMARATVLFDRVGEKTLILKYANLIYVSPPRG
ncbi:MAG: ATP-dependent helicase, partial [Alphaproteobacteria bacterium]